MIDAQLQDEVSEFWYPQACRNGTPCGSNNMGEKTTADIHLYMQFIYIYYTLLLNKFYMRRIVKLHHDFFRLAPPE